MPLASIQQILFELAQEPAERERAVKEKMGLLIADIYSSGLFYAEAVHAFKRQYIKHVLLSHNGNKFRAAIELGMHRNTLDRTIAELKLPKSEWDPKLQLSGVLPATKSVQPAVIPVATEIRQA